MDRKNVAICAIAAMEELYIKDWIEYHLSKGFNHIYLIDNNDPNYEVPLKPIIRKYIDEGTVTYLVDSRKNDNEGNGDNIQSLVYTKVYNGIKDKHDYILFIDIDEYWTSPYESVQDFLESQSFGKELGIAFTWMIYDDNDLLYYEDKPVIERFTRVADLGTPIRRMDTVKCMINCKFDTSIFNRPLKITAHSVRPMNDHLVDTLNDPITLDKCHVIYDNNDRLDACKQVARINHYYTKTIEEFAKYKIHRHHIYSNSSPYSLEMFFKYNHFSIEKQDLWHKITDQGESIK